MAKRFQFVSEMQNTALEIKDHRVISRAMQRSFGNLIFEGFLPAFKINNVVWFQHENSKANAGDIKKSGRSREPWSETAVRNGVVSHTAASALLHRRN
jgi:hypothetical protein